MQENETLPVVPAAVESAAKPVVTERASRVLLEILVYGVEKDKKQIKKMLDAIQEQMVKARKGKFVRTLWYLDNAEKTDDEKKQWLIDNVKAKYYVFAHKDRYVVAKDFVRETLQRIKRLEDAVFSMKTAGIIVSKNKIEEIIEPTVTE